MQSVLGVRAYSNFPNVSSLKNQRNFFSQRVKSGCDTFVKNSSQISFTAMPRVSDPYAIPREATGFVDDLFMDDGLTQFNYQDAIRLMTRSGRLNDLKKACDNAQNYQVYDGVGYYDIDLKKDAPMAVAEELIRLGRVREAVPFLRKHPYDGTREIDLLSGCGLSEADKTAYGLQTHIEAIMNLQTDEEKKRYLDDMAKKTKKAKVLAGKNEAVKDKLRPFIDRLISDYCSRPARFPNCIMLIGKNNYAINNIMDWLKSTAKNTNFVKVEANYDCDVLQNKLYETLNKAQENYEVTGKRSIIYVDHLDRLINRKINSPENIAGMKRVMCSADSQYHSTIIFSVKPDDISDFEPGALKSHRVGLKIDVPISLSDMDLIHV